MDCTTSILDFLSLEVFQHVLKIPKQPITDQPTKQLNRKKRHVHFTLSDRQRITQPHTLEKLEGGWNVDMKSLLEDKNKSAKCAWVCARKQERE